MRPQDRVLVIDKIEIPKPVKAPSVDCVPCDEYKQAVANTIVRIRKASKTNGEDFLLTGMKVNAVQTHNFANGQIAILTYEEGGRMIYCGINIRKK